MEDYKKKTDEELCVLAQNKDTDAMEVLINRYRSMAVAFARSYFLNSGDTDDLTQEGLIGIFRAIETFNGSSSFKSYVHTCIKSRIFSAIKTSQSKKNIPLNNYISLTGFIDTNGDKFDFMVDNNFDPEQTYINKEAEKELVKEISNALSIFENKILQLYLQGFSYSSIAEKVKKTEKAVDNALQRIKRKLSNIIEGKF